MPFPTSVAARAGKYSEIRAVGKGAYGQVYFAKDNLGREVAIKEALPSALDFQLARTKFQKEAQVQAAFRHPNIVHVYHLEEDPESHELYLVSEYANGGSLADHLEAHGALSEPEAVLVARDICQALEEISAKRIVHRDIKPSNILLVRDSQGTIAAAKLGDFGIAQDLKARGTTVVPGMSYPGTVLYMPPEQANVANLLDVRADIYALGITLWEMLTAEHYKLLAATATPDLKRYNPRASAAVAAIITRTVREKPAERYQTAQEMRRDLEAALAGTGQHPYTAATIGAQPAVDGRSGAQPGPKRRGPTWLGRVRSYLRPTSRIRKLIWFALLVSLLTGVVYWASPLVLPAVPLTMAHSSNLDPWLKKPVDDFEEKATVNRFLILRRRIKVVRLSQPSGELYEQALQARVGSGPTVWIPSSSAWLAMLQQERGDPAISIPLFACHPGDPKIPLSQCPLLVTPLTIAMWKPMAEALGWPRKPIGWSELLDLIDDPQGWAKFGHPEWGRFTMGQTDPMASSTALSTVIAEFYAATGKSSSLTVKDVQAPESQQFLRQLARGIKHYGFTTEVFINNMKSFGMSYVSALPMEERQVIAYNTKAPPIPLVAIYLRDGALLHDNPFILLKGASPEQQLAANQLYTFLRSPEHQREAMVLGYRPGNLQVAIGPPIAPQFGADPAQPQSLLEIPSGAVLVAARKAWPSQP